MIELSEKEHTELAKMRKERDEWKSSIQKLIKSLTQKHNKTGRSPLQSVHEDNVQGSMDLLVKLAQGIALDPNQTKGAQDLIDHGKLLARAETNAIRAYEDWADNGDALRFPGWTQLSAAQRNKWIKLYTDAELAKKG